MNRPVRVVNGPLHPSTAVHSHRPSRVPRTEEGKRKSIAHRHSGAWRRFSVAWVSFDLRGIGWPMKPVGLVLAFLRGLSCAVGIHDKEGISVGYDYCSRCIWCGDESVD
jgi:hypothetical protein